MKKPKAQRKRDLKEENRSALAGLIGVNLLVFGVLLATKTLAIPSLLLDPSSWKPMIPASASLVICGALNELASPMLKARMVYLRWNDPLPGREAFSAIGPADQRVNMASLTAKVGPLLVSPSEQNRLWYSLYLTVENEPSVVDAHKSFLLCRDYTLLAILTFFTLGPIALFSLKFSATGWMYTTFLVVQVIAARQAAANAGRRFVANVLALVSANAKLGHR